MIDRHIAKSILEIALFLEYSGEDAVDPDAAVAAFEQLAANLQLASDQTRIELTGVIREMASDYPEHRDYISELPAALGLA